MDRVIVFPNIMTRSPPKTSGAALGRSMDQDLVANVSHELRTPLTVFLGYLELLQSEHEFTREQSQEIFSQMRGQAQRMERLVNDLLLLSRLENDIPDREAYSEVFVSKILEEIIVDAKRLSADQEHEIILEADAHLTLMGDEEELRSAFSNLIYNAVRYTPAKGKIEVRWFQEENTKRFDVQDTGIGIAEKYIPQITRRFYRVDKARSRGKGGTGLGLAIVKHVLLRHKGKLLIKSRLNVGSIFSCIFPSHLSS